MFYSGILTDGGGGRKEGDLREAASLRQQRRIKQSVQFIHKDSADLLPLDGLKRLGTSKDTQPHNILQRRLLETNLSKVRPARASWPPKGESNKFHQAKCAGTAGEEDLISVWCQCAGKAIRASIDTSCQHNLIPSACVERLGLKEHFRSCKNEEENAALPYNMTPIGQIERLAVTLGSLTLECAAVVIDDNDRYLSLGLQTLRSMKCTINLDKNQLEIGGSDPEVIPFIVTKHNAKENPPDV
ncbi:nuclear receptor-interacting protein 3 [Spea bombifrons]|uniref:nuclear receptor-interacting protein 3 n=1 Tax=Spea bombifrons TaxID=233779 RepID=UPI00234AF042|nr:nuclear receptor-interacting protein 3 [Spea bombifrons]